MTTIENHMRELIEQARSELPAEPNDSDIVATALGPGGDAQNKAWAAFEEFKLRQTVEVAKVFRERHDRLPRTWRELLDDPVCGEIIDRQQAALANQILEGIKGLTED